MNEFDKALKRLLIIEGGYSDHPDDPGGRTNYGVTQGLYDIWRRSRGFAKQSVAAITPGEAYEIYYRLFWLENACDRVAILSYGVAEELFEASVNCGALMGARLLQRAMNFVRYKTDVPLLEDGRIGIKTLTRLGEIAQRRHLPALIAAQNGEQYLLYRGLVDGNEKYRSFARGWMRRVMWPEELL